jgi:thioredoxin reductase (NADPH)
VITNDQCATNIDGIYVVGDLRERYARQIVLAAADGCMAALSVAHYVETRKAKMEDPTCALPE